MIASKVPIPVRAHQTKPITTGKPSTRPLVNSSLDPYRSWYNNKEMRVADMLYHNVFTGSKTSPKVIGRSEFGSPWWTGFRDDGTRLGRRVWNFSAHRVHARHLFSECGVAHGYFQGNNLRVGGP